MQVLTNNVPIAQWKMFMQNCNFTTPFQSPEFFDLLNSVPGLSAKVIAIEECKEILALCVVTFQKEKGAKGFFSRRAIIYGGPLLVESEKGKLALNALLISIKKELKQKVIYIETRNFFDYSYFKDCFKEHGWEYLPYLNVQISLQGKSMNDILEAMKYNRRREILMSTKEDAIVTEAENTDDVKVLYKILSNVYKNKIKLPVPDLVFFIGLFNSDIGKVFIVKHNGKITGGSFCFLYPNTSLYTMYYCGLRDYHPKIFPTHLSILASIEFGLKNNLQKVDLMGAGKPDQEYGVRKYKSEFGGTLVEHGRFLNICNPFLFNLGKMGLKVIKKIKK
jgi:serine/alanine adding enzyme